MPWGPSYCYRVGPALCVSRHSRACHCLLSVVPAWTMPGRRVWSLPLYGSSIFLWAVPFRGPSSASSVSGYYFGLFGGCVAPTPQRCTAGPCCYGRQLPPVHHFSQLRRLWAPAFYYWPPTNAKIRAQSNQWHTEYTSLTEASLCRAYLHKILPPPWSAADAQHHFAVSDSLCATGNEPPQVIRPHAH